MKTAIVVLGMHRSGTSSVAGALSLLGAAAPKTLMAPAADNPKGFWESNVVMALNDALLAERGLIWSDWRGRPAGPSPVVDPRIMDAMKSEFGEADLLVLKDPRMCRLFPEWRLALADAGFAVAVVSPIRTPAEVAASLMARNPLSRAHGLRLWLRHVLDAEIASRGLPRHLMTWASFLSDWRGQLARMNSRLSVDVQITDDQAAEVDAFLSDDLHRQRSEETTPVLVRQTWNTLCQIAEFGDHPDLLARLDTLRSDFDRACDLFPDAP